MSKEEKKLADAMRIFEALSGVEEALLVRCEESCQKRSARRRFLRYYGSAAAACLCLAVCGAVLLQSGMLSWGNGSASTERSVKLESIRQEMAAACDEAEPEETDLKGFYETPEERSVSAEEELITAGTESVDIASLAGTNNVDKEPAAGAEGGYKEPAAGAEDGYQEAAEAGKKMEIEDADTGDAGSSSGSSIQEKKDTITDLESSSAVTEACLAYNGERITLQEAKEIELLGAYVPDTLPTGFVLESVYRENNEKTGVAECISICWTKGMDSIFWAIFKADTAEIVSVDVAKPETYDVHLYEIPYADTVPVKYRALFEEPVFAEKDFSLDVVKSRMKVVSDMGDTDTPQGNFSVLYEDGVVVRFNGNADAESVYKMFP